MAKARPQKGGQSRSPSPAQAGNPRRGSGVAFVLLLLLILLWSVWLAFHVSGWLAKIPGGLAVLSGATWLWGRAKSQKKDPGKIRAKVSRIEKYLWEKLDGLGRRGVALLALLLLASLCVFATTGSIHLNYETGDGVSQDVEVLISRGDAAPFLGPVRLSERHSSFSRIFLTPPWCDLKIQTRPRVWETESVRIGWQRAVHLEVPMDFDLRKLPLLGLVPGEGLYRFLPDPEDGLPSYYDLTLRVGGKTHRIPGLRRERILLGSGVEEMQIVAGQGAGEWNRRLELALKRKMPETFEDSSQHPLLVNPIRFVPIELRGDDVVKGTITKKGNHPGSWPFQPRKVPSTSPWTFLERTP